MTITNIDTVISAIQHTSISLYRSQPFRLLDIEFGLGYFWFGLIDAGSVGLVVHSKQ